MKGYPLLDVVGDERNVKELEQLGIRSTLDLLAALPDSDAVKDVADRAGIDSKTLAEHLAVSDLVRISGIGPITAHHLVSALGIKNIYDLRRAVPADVTAKLGRTAGHDVSLEAVERWIAQASALPLMTEPAWIDEELMSLVERRRQARRKAFRRISVPCYVLVAAIMVLSSAHVAVILGYGFTRSGLPQDLALGLGWTVFSHHLGADGTLVLGFVLSGWFLKALARWIRSKTSRPIVRRMAIEERVLCSHWLFVMAETQTRLRFYVLGVVLGAGIAVGASVLITWGDSVLSSYAVMRIFGDVSTTAAAYALSSTILVSTWSAVWLSIFLRRTRHRVRKESLHPGAIRGLLVLLLRDLLLTAIGVLAFLHVGFLIVDAAMSIREHETQSIEAVYDKALRRDPARWNLEAFVTHETETLEISSNMYLYTNLVSRGLLEVLLHGFLLITAGWVVVVTVRMALLFENTLSVLVRVVATIGLSVGFPIALESSFLGSFRLPLTAGAFVAATVALILELMKPPSVSLTSSQEPRRNSGNVYHDSSSGSLQ
ncbi:DUF4332 domain-containing protein [Candidatus Bipolaricaulota bacterium]|nr:DUF4332 domain-containing protein [Candidatus Bipolaricaulota bacterium]